MIKRRKRMEIMILFEFQFLKLKWFEIKNFRNNWKKKKMTKLIEITKSSYLQSQSNFKKIRLDLENIQNSGKHEDR